MNGADIIIVGAGPAGLAAAIELGRRGIDTLVVEQDFETPRGHPRAGQIHVRTMEFFRRWGIADRVRAESPLPPGFGPFVTFGTSLTGHEISTVPVFSSSGPSDRISAEAGGVSPQWHFTGLMEEVASSLQSVTIERGWRFRSMTYEEAGVSAEVESSRDGVRRRLFGKYLIGADGGRGTVRRSSGASYQGVPEISRWLYVPFIAPSLRHKVTLAKSMMYFLFTPEGTIVSRPTTRDFWDIQLTNVSPDTPIASVDLMRTIKAAVGPASVAIDVGEPSIIGLHDFIADSYGGRRVFLAGDAAHLIVHFGGHNGNTGIGDGVNLGWKLAAILQGWGGPALLEAYESERRPVALRTRATALSSMQGTGQALFDAAAGGVPAGDSPADERERQRLGEAISVHASRAWRADGVTLDQRYESAVIIGDATEVPEWDSTKLANVPAPGHRAPHVREGASGSVHDWFGPGFTLLRVGATDSGAELIAAAHDRGVPLTVLDRDGDAYREAYGGVGLTLIRPDDHIAWRGSGSVNDPLRVIDTIRGAVPGA